jgi:hypothetical protein
MDAEGFFFERRGGKESAAKFSLEKDALVIVPQGGKALRVPLRDLASISNSGYVISMKTRTEDGYELRRLGKRHADMARELCLAKNELLLDDLLIREKMRRPAVRCDMEYDGLKDKGEVRLYRTSIVLLPDNGPLRHLRYSEVRQQEVKDFALRLNLEQGEFLLRMLGKELTPLDKDLETARAEMATMALKTVDDLCPGLPTEARVACAELLKEGSSAWRTDVRQASPQLWNSIEMRLRGLGLGSSYDYLTSKGEATWMRIGLKKPLMEGGEDYLWFLAPTSKGGNAIAWEAASEEGGRATYFFRISMEKGREAKGLEEEAVQRVAQGLIDVNLRREPIYLKDEMLYRPEYTAYRHACNALPSLLELRRRFIGRVMHSDETQWAADVTELLAFSLSSSPGQRWVKAGEEEAP